MPEVGELERLAQERVVAFLQAALGYRYLGNWTDRDGNSHIEEDLLTAWLEQPIKGYTGEAFVGYDKEDVEGLLKDRLQQDRERLEEAHEALKALCEPVEPPRDTAAYLRYFCAIFARLRQPGQRGAEAGYTDAEVAQDDSGPHSPARPLGGRSALPAAIPGAVSGSAHP